jgi:hypothetical protein
MPKHTWDGARNESSVREHMATSSGGGEQALGRSQRRKIMRDAVRDPAGFRTASDIRTKTGQGRLCLKITHLLKIKTAASK